MLQGGESDKPCQGKTKTSDIPARSCKLGSGCCSSRGNNAALKAFKLTHLNEKRVRRAILDAESKMELARVEAEAETDVDSGDDTEYVESLEWTARVAQYLKECTVNDEALEGSFQRIQICSETPRANTMTPGVASSELPKVE
ncbi:unnamed protein product [Schistocephalus solidus]|uniref:Uncharacterized protein n=1 Tax=Schistocephalus solidus TaxID=70667 RepID=A0A183TM85_SCHSO|nr:unnamed protein product [Schistocephalus solidus]